MGERPDFALEERRGDFGQQAAGKIRPGNWQLIDVNRKIRDVLSERPQTNTPVEIKIHLAELEKPAKRFEHLEASLHAFAAQRVEHDVDALPPGEFAHGIAKGEIARIEDIVGAGQPQKRSLHLRSGRRGHNRTALFGVLDSGQSDTSGGSVDQHMLAWRKLRQVAQSVHHCDKSHRYRRGLGKARFRRYRCDRVGDRHDACAQ